MKRKRKHNAQQYEFGLTDEPWRLVGAVLPPGAPPAAPAAGSLVDPKQLEMNKPDYCDHNAPEYKVARVRDCAWPQVHPMTDPSPVSDFWRAHVESAAWYRQDQECMVVIMVNTRRYPIGFSLLSLGTLDTCLCDVRAVFRVAIMKSAAAIILCHNHPSGDPTPSEADIKMTRELMRAGQLLKIEVLDHVIHGTATAERPTTFSSLRALGYFYS